MAQWVKAFAAKLDTHPSSIPWTYVVVGEKQLQIFLCRPHAYCGTCACACTHMYTCIHTNVIKIKIFDFKKYIFFSTSLEVVHCVRDNVRNWVLHLGTNEWMSLFSYCKDFILSLIFVCFVLTLRDTWSLL